MLILAIGTVVILDARQYGIFGWGSAGPQPGLYPFLLGIGVIAGGLVVVGQTVLRAPRAEAGEPFIPPGALKPILSVAIPAALTLVLTQFIGLYLASGLYLAVYMRWIGRHRWITVAACSILIPLSGYILFDKLFLIPVPEGSLTGRLGLGF
jgi:hypothetical protein